MSKLFIPSARTPFNTRAAFPKVNGAGAYLIRATDKNNSALRDPRNTYDNGSYIYIDGYAHTGQFGGRTLSDWWPKLKAGGIFAGHDYHPEWPRTVAEVNLFARSRGLPVNVTSCALEYPSWWVMKPAGVAP